MDSFRVRVSDVTGFAETRSKKATEFTIHIYGAHSEIATGPVNHGDSTVIEKWFRAHPAFGGATQGAATAPTQRTGSVADEPAKLAALRDSNLLSEEEFQDLKRRLLY